MAKPEAPPKATAPLNGNDAEKQAEPDALATPSEVFSFARTRRVKMYIVGGMACAVVSGAVFPGKEYF
jgi:hypothetical protein